MRFLIDTNIFIYNARDPQRLRSQYSDIDLNAIDVSVFCSVVSLGEIRSFARKRGWGQDRTERVLYLFSKYVTIDISSNDTKLIDAYSAIESFSESIGKTMGKNDLWIAATSLVTKSILLTTDNDFNHLDQQIFDGRAFSLRLLKVK